MTALEACGSSWASGWTCTTAHSSDHARSLTCWATRELQVQIILGVSSSNNILWVSKRMGFEAHEDASVPGDPEGPHIYGLYTTWEMLVRSEDTAWASPGALEPAQGSSKNGYNFRKFAGWLLYTGLILFFDRAQSMWKFLAPARAATQATVWQHQILNLLSYQGTPSPYFLKR